MDINDFDNAKNYFLKSLEIFPDFKLAKANLEFIENKMKTKD